MYIEDNYAKNIQRYLDAGTSIHQLVNLRSRLDPSHLELLAITSSSIVKYRKERKQVIVDMVYLRHVTAIQLVFDRLPVGRLIAGILLSVIGFILFIGGFSMLGWYYGYGMGITLLFIGLIFLIPLGLFLLITAIRRAGGMLRIYSYDADKGIVDARFSREQAETVIGISRDLQKLLAVEIHLGSSMPIIPTPVPTPPAPVPVTAQVVNPGVKHCAVCGSEIGADQAYCIKCGVKQ